MEGTRQAVVQGYRLSSPPLLRAEAGGVTRGLQEAVSRTDAGGCYVGQVALHEMYEQYYEEDPEGRKGPIPTVWVSPPGAHETMSELHYIKTHGTAKVISGRLDKIMHSLWRSMRALHSTMAAGHRDYVMLSRITGCLLPSWQNPPPRSSANHP